MTLTVVMDRMVGIIESTIRMKWIQLLRFEGLDIIGMLQ